MRSIPPESASQFGAFTTEQALSAGWSRAGLNREVDTGRLIRLRRAAYACADETATATRLHGLSGVAAALRLQRSVVSHGAAVALHGLPLLKVPADPCITLPPEFRTRPARLHVHRQHLPPGQFELSSAIALTSVPRSCLDLTREMGILAGLVTTDAALRAGLTTAGELEQVYRTLHAGSGLPSGRQLLELADGRSESPLESVSRFHLRELPEQPELQVQLFDVEGHFLGRADFFWRSAALVGEADGMAKYDDAELRREKRRQDAMLRAGLLVTRWGWSTAISPRRLCRQVGADLARAYALRRAGMPVTIHAA